MPSELKFNVGMNKTEFMTGSKEVARAIASLKTTVMQAGKSMNSSAAGYGTAMRQYSKVSREASQSIQSIKTRLDSLRQSTTAIKSAADAFRTLQERIEASEKDITKMQGQMSTLESSGGKYSQAWQENQKNIATARAELEKTTNAYHDYDEAVKYAQKRLATGKDEWGHPLSNEERKTYAEEAKYNQEYADKASAQMAKMQANVQALEREEAALIAQGQNLPSEAWQRLQTEIDSARQSVENMKEELGAMKQKGFENADQTSEYTSQVNAVKSLEAALDAAQSKKNELIKPPYMQAWDNMTRLSGLVAEGFGRIQNVAQGALYAVTHPIQAIDRALGTVIAKTGQAVSAFARMAGSAAVNFLKRLASEARNAAIQLAKMAANAVTSGFKKIASGVATATKGILKFNRAHKGTGDTLKMGLRNILRYAFGIRSMFFLFRRLRAAISEGFGELKKQNPEVRASLNSLTSAFNGLKASLASAFAPILTVVAPALTALINMLTAAMNAVAAFMAALGGGATFSKAIGGLKGVGGAAGGAGKKVDKLKRTLEDFDELTIIEDKDKSGGGGGGAGGGGSSLKYQTEQIPGAIQDFVNSLKKAWEEADYFKVGNLVAEKINGVFEDVVDMITWENVQNKVQEGVTAIAGVFNGLTDPAKGIDFELIGKTFSEGVRTLINSIDELVNKISTANIGIGIANFFNGILANKSLFEDAKKGLQDVTTAVTNLAAAFLENFGEATLAQRIRETLGDASMWEGIGEKVWNVITLAFNKTGNFLNVLLGGEDRTQDPNVTRMMRQKPKDIVPEYEIDGTVFDDLATNLANGINTALESVTEFISNHSPTNAIYALSGWITKIRKGIHWDVVGKFLGTSFKTVLDGLGAWITEWSEEAETIGGDIATAINGFIDAAFDGDTIATHFTDAVKGAFSLVKGFVEKINEEKAATEIKEAIEGIDWNGIAETAWEAFKAAVEKLGNFLTLLFGGELDVTETVPDFTEEQKNRPENRLMRKRRSDVSIHTEGEEKETQSALTKAIGNTVSAVLTQIDEWVTGIDWPTIGAGLRDFLAALPWDEWGNQLAKALTDLFDGLDDFISAAIYGEDYKNNLLWQLLHPNKNAEETVGNIMGNSANAEEVLAKYGMSKDDFKKLQADVDAGPRGGGNVAVGEWEKANNKLQEIIHAIDVADAPELVAQLRANGDLDNTIAQKLAEEFKFNTEEIATALGLNTDALNENTTTTAESNAENLENDSASELFDKAMELIKSGTTRNDALKNLEAGGALPDKLSAVDEALDHVRKGLLGWVEDDKVKQILDAADKTSTISPEESKAVFDAAAQEIHDAEESLSNASEDWEAAWRAETEDYVRAREEETTQAGEFLRETYGSLGDLITGRAHAEEGQGVYSEDFFKNMEAQERQTKESKKNTKELKKNTKKRAEVDVNYEGAGFDTSGEKPTLNVGVNFAPNGEEPSEENTNGGLLGWLQTLLDPGVSVETKVEMIKEGWTSFLNFLGVDTENPIIKTLIDLLLGKQEDGAQEALDAEDKDVDVDVDLLEGQTDNGAVTALDAEDKDVDVDVDVNKGGNMSVEDAEKVDELESTTTTRVANMNVNKGGNMNLSDADKVQEYTGATTTRTANMKVDKQGNMTVSDGTTVQNFNSSTTTRTANMKVDKQGNLSIADGAKVQGFTGATTTRTANMKVNKKGKMSVSDGKSVQKFNNSTTTRTANMVVNKKGKMSVSDAKSVNKIENGTVTRTFNLKVTLDKLASNVKTALKALGFNLDTGGVISRSGKLTRFASGGAIMRNGRASWWNSVNKYAAGTTRAHGTVFVAGENGPEIMGHVNGRTEILNKSQLADAMYGAVVAGMANAVNSLGSYLANRMATCTNAIVSTISANSDISALAGMNYYAPAMATGGIMPYDVAMQISRSAQDIQNTLNANNEDLIQAMVSAMGNAANSIVQILQRQMMQNSVSSRGNRSTDAIDAINRQSLMYGKSPLKGV